MLLSACPIQNRNKSSGTRHFRRCVNAKAPERMKPARLPANFLQDRMQAPSQHNRLMQRSSCRGFENEAFRSARYVIVYLLTPSDRVTLHAEKSDRQSLIQPTFNSESPH